ncbi:MAG: threonine--tRNA ligase [Phycisphaerales bacterium]|jgi:threonyl-tRNA synthetase|nr:threonine--tRNA ligase [Phycisphaerales bacterium]
MSITIQFPDGNSQQYDSQTTSAQIAESISGGLARVAVAAVLNGCQIDLSTPIEDGEHTLRILTPRDPESLEVLRHTAAHIMAQAVRNLYGDKVQYTIGPALTDDFQYGFYYDFDLPESVSADDFGKIEAEMKKIAKSKTPLERIELTPAEAKQQMTELGQSYKVEMIDDLIASEEGVETVSFYRQGDFVDMCRGPHLPNTGKLKAFKLLTLAGAYWRGDEKNKTLTRIYGTAFFDKKELAEHLDRIAEAKKRDHRILGKQLGLFALSDDVGPGLPLWMPKGTIIRMELEGWLRGQLLKRGYQAVMTPHIGKLDLYRTSGHYPYYEHGLFPTLPMGEDEGYLLKPMNCPHHIQIYKAAQRSYRELPVRLSEFGTVYRFEKSGDLNGLTRVRGFTQDDAHIFCSPEQLEAEIASCVELTKLVLDTLGLDQYRVRIGLRDPDSSKYTGKSENWDLAEQNIRNVVRDVGLEYTEEPGEAAFYGPKIDFVINDCIGREWQLGTIQVDYNLPERFGLEYIGSDNTPHRPIMIHRAPLGSPERFIGILIEHFAGAFPLWLAPVQVAVLPVSEKCADYAAEQTRILKNNGIRVELDDSPEKIGAKIRRATLDKVPYMLILGQKEADANTVAVRHRTEGDFGEVDITEFISEINAEIETKGSQCVANRVQEQEDR